MRAAKHGGVGTDVRVPRVIAIRLDARLGRVDPAVSLGDLAAVERQPRASETEAGIRTERLRRKRREPAVDGSEVPPVEVIVPVRRDQLRCIVDVPGCCRVLDGVGDRAVRAVPVVSAPVEIRDPIRVRTLQLVPQQLTEQQVVAIPLPRGVERKQE